MKKSEKVSPDMVSKFVKGNAELIKSETGLDIADFKSVKHYLSAVVFGDFKWENVVLFEVLTHLYFKIQKFPHKDFT